MFLCRKFSRAKWEAPVELPRGSVGADAVTADLKTSGNTLSVWQCRPAAADVDAPAPDALDDVALALASGFERLDRLDLVWFPAAVLTGRAVTVKATDGETPVVGLRSRHRDLTGLCIGKLGVVAEVVATAVGQSHHRRLTKSQLKVLLVRAINDGRLRLDDLQEKVRAALAPGDG